MKLSATSSKRTQTVSVDGYPDLTIDVWVNPPMGLLTRVQQKTREADDVETGIEFLEGWNLTDDEDKPLPINRVALEQLPSDVYIAVFRRIFRAIRESNQGPNPN